MKFPVVLAVAVCALSGVAAAGPSDWPSLRGPRHDGAAPAALEASAGAGFAVAWRRALGAGYSAVAVAEGRAVTLFSDGKEDAAAAFDARTDASSGARDRADAGPQDGSFDGPIATPAPAAAGLRPRAPRSPVRLDAATGRELWTVDLVTREGANCPSTASPRPRSRRG